MSNADTSPKKSLFKQWWFWLIMAIFFVIFLNILATASTSTPVTNEPTTTKETKNEPQEPPVAVATVPYEIYSEDDISYGGCKRVGIKVIVAADVDKTAVDNTLNQILEGKKSSWQDITVWGYSKDVDPSKFGANMGMKEYSICK